MDFTQPAEHPKTAAHTKTAEHTKATAQSPWLGPILAQPLDIVFGMLLTLIALADIMSSFSSSPPLTILGTLLATAPLIARTAYPWWTVRLVPLGLVVLLASRPYLGIWAAPVLFSVIVTFYTMQRQLTRRYSWILAGCLIAVALTAAVWPAFIQEFYPYGGQDLVIVAGGIGAVAVAGATLWADLSRSRTEVEEVRAVNVETLREQAAMEERARIAREMHDLVAHSISMVAVRAETAPYTIDDLGEDAKREFAEIATAARETLTEMRRLLGVLRADMPPETAPQPGLKRLPELIEQHSGQVDVDVVGTQRELPQAVDVSAYRIIQEALTNARTHAPGARVSIEIAYRPETLALRIADDGPGPSGGESEGHGLIGMRERALALGGWFSAGPGPSGGFLIQTGLPTE